MSLLAPLAPTSFYQLKADLTNTNFKVRLVSFAICAITRLDNLTVAKLREKAQALNCFASLYAARICLVGTHKLGDTKLYADKQRVAVRQKIEAYRL